MLSVGNLKIAAASVRGTRWRSSLTILGIVIGIVSVVTIISLGEGVKQQINQSVGQRDKNQLTVLPGRHVFRDKSGNITHVNSLITQATPLFTEAEYVAVLRSAGVKEVLPFSQIPGQVAKDSTKLENVHVLATTHIAPAILSQKVTYGSFFSENEKQTNGAVIGRRVAETLFRENVPLGKSFTFRDREFIVRGVFEQFPDSSPFLPGSDYNDAIFIPYETGRELMGGSMQLYQLLVTPDPAKNINTTIRSIDQALSRTRGSQQDYTILKQSETIALGSNLLGLITRLITSVAAISLLVGGIGIMNIMLVSVTERTSEIGIRKAVGATNRQILGQFLMEAAVLSLTGGILGIFFSVLTNFLLRIVTDLQPVITLPVVLSSAGIALGIGIVFGIAPAAIAAHKDPIEALRYE